MAKVLLQMVGIVNSHQKLDDSEKEAYRNYLGELSRAYQTAKPILVTTEYKLKDAVQVQRLMDLLE
jgi:hypothetical protein